MKKFILFIVMLISVFGFAQNSGIKLGLGYYHSAKYKVGTADANASGFALMADYSYNFNNNILSASVIFSPDIDVVGNGAGGNSHTQFAVMYGRDLNVSKSVAVEPFAGISFYNLTDTTRYFDRSLGTKSGIGFPVMMNVMLNKQGKFNFGTTLNYNINGFANIFSGFLAARYKF